MELADRAGPSAILPGMAGRNIAAKPGVTIVGAGSLASALAPALLEAGYRIDGIVARAGAASRRRAQVLARKVNTLVRNAPQPDSCIVWFCVPDGQIARAAGTFADTVSWRGKVALHSSGALTSDELSALRHRGAATASVHPLMTFVRGSKPVLAGTPFAIEGDARAVRAARALVRALPGQPFLTDKRNKAAYHAWGMFASPLLTSLLETAERVAAAAGVPGKEARRRMLPILRQTLENYAALGAAGALSGPIQRGDAATVKKHLRVLRRMPEARSTYVALARASLRYLPAKNRSELSRLLKV